MSRMCDICGKGPTTGSSISRRGLAKKQGGIGLHTTAVNKRRFLPNLQRVKARVNGGTQTLRVCTRCIKSGKIAKA